MINKLKILAYSLSLSLIPLWSNPTQAGDPDLGYFLMEIQSIYLFENGESRGRKGDIFPSISFDETPDQEESTWYSFMPVNGEEFQITSEVEASNPRLRKVELGKNYQILDDTHTPVHSQKIYIPQKNLIVSDDGVSAIFSFKITEADSFRAQRLLPVQLDVQMPLADVSETLLTFNHTWKKEGQMVTNRMEIGIRVTRLEKNDEGSSDALFSSYNEAMELLREIHFALENHHFKALTTVFETSGSDESNAYRLQDYNAELLSKLRESVLSFEDHPAKERLFTSYVLLFDELKSKTIYYYEEDERFTMPIISDAEFYRYHIPFTPLIEESPVENQGGNSTSGFKTLYYIIFFGPFGLFEMTNQAGNQ